LFDLYADNVLERFNASTISFCKEKQRGQKIEYIKLKCASLLTTVAESRFNLMIQAFSL